MAYRTRREDVSYGGDEVELSVWTRSSRKQPVLGHQETEMGQRSSSQRNLASEKRIPTAPVLPPTLVANNALNSRQPVQNICLSYLSRRHSSRTQRGDVRRYDTRAARKPVAEWKQISKGNGIGTVAKGHNEQYGTIHFPASHVKLIQSSHLPSYPSDVPRSSSSRTRRPRHRRPWASRAIASTNDSLSVPAGLRPRRRRGTTTSGTTSPH